MSDNDILQTLNISKSFSLFCQQQEYLDTDMQCIVYAYSFFWGGELKWLGQTKKIRNISIIFIILV